jgi:hypothetical protein
MGSEFGKNQIEQDFNNNYLKKEPRKITKPDSLAFYGTPFCCLLKGYFETIEIIFKINKPFYQESKTKE